MALSSALFSGITGLSSLGQAMQVIGDNIANVNTVGFKSSTYTFQDLLSQAVATQAGTSQVGKGVTLSDIYQSFQQGSFETTSSTTDLAIGGSGFFELREAESTNMLLSRAGNFRFDKDGYLVNPEGYVVQGWELNDDGEDISSTTDIRLDSFTSPPSASDEIQLILNLDESETEASTGTLEDAWVPFDGTSYTASAMGENQSLYQTSIKVYDNLGATHDITAYFDKTGTDHVWEYVLTCNPLEDERSGFDAGDNRYARGLLGRGTITFEESSGKIGDLTLELCDGHDGTDPTFTGGVLDADDVNASGYLEFDTEFIAGESQAIALNFGSFSDGTNWAPDSLTTTQFSKASTTVFQSSTGYGAGDLQGVNVDVDGVITGIYSNGEVIPLYRVAVADVVNPVGLEKVGGNLYKTTRLSGEAPTYHPGTNGTGNIAPNSLEQSNVDIANEFVKMITTQRGFQANGKIITVTDQMLAELINLKR
ncbi:MAG: flagellar hook protein FlgE [Deltaproteobacteria bacterium]|nr:flagellar hook protein FlgE [Deltaproteobacteria bacterium]